MKSLIRRGRYSPRVFSRMMHLVAEIFTVFERFRWGIVGGVVAALACGAGMAHAQGPVAGGLCVDRLLAMSWPELEELYRHAEAGTIPRGFARGWAIYCPDSPLSGVRSKMTHLMWRGKVFDACGGSLVNQWCGLRAIKACVAYGPSCLDGQPSIIMDYSHTSHVWADVRDEVREVAPGLYLGRMYRRTRCGPEFKLFFVLQVCPAGP